MGICLGTDSIHMTTFSCDKWVFCLLGSGFEAFFSEGAAHPFNVGLWKCRRCTRVWKAFE